MFFDVKLWKNVGNVRVTASRVRNRARSARMWGFGGTAPKKGSPCRTSALCRSRSVWWRRCDCMVCVVFVCRVCPHAVRPLFVAAASDPPTRTIGSSRRVSGRRPPDPEGSPEPQQKHGCGRARWHSTQFASTTGPQFFPFFKP